MEELNKNCLLYLNENLNINVISKNSNELIGNVYNFFKELKSINDYDKYIRTFPIYPEINFKVINFMKFDGGYFSKMKIQNIVDHNLDYINSILTRNVISMKNETDEYPNDPEILGFTNSLQKSILNSEFLNQKLLHLNTSRINRRYSCLYYLVNDENTPPYDSSYDKLNFCELITLYYSILNITVNYSQAFFQIARDIYEHDAFDTSSLKSDIDKFINNDEFSMLLSNMVCQKVFNIFIPGEKFIGGVNNFTKEKMLPKLSKIVQDYIDSRDIPKYFLTTFLRKIQNLIGYFVFQELIKQNKNVCFKDDYETRRSSDLDKIFNTDYVTNLISKKVSVNTLTEYLLPVYLYKNESYKFLSSIGRFVELYCDHHIYSNVDYLNKFSYQSRNNNKVNDVLRNLDNNKIYEFLESLDYNKLVSQNNLPWFITFMFSDDLLKSFFNSEEFTNHIIEILEDYYWYLYNERWILYKHNWFQNIEMIRHIIISYFLNYSNVDNQSLVFPTLQESLKNDVFYDRVNIVVTPDNIQRTLDNLVENDSIKLNIYNMSSNILYASIKRRLYYHVLSYFVE